MDAKNISEVGSSSPGVWDSPEVFFIYTHAHAQTSHTHTTSLDLWGGWFLQVQHILAHLHTVLNLQGNPATYAHVHSSCIWIVFFSVFSPMSGLYKSVFWAKEQMTVILKGVAHPEWSSSPQLYRPLKYLSCQSNANQTKLGWGHLCTGRLHWGVSRGC